MLEFDTLLLPQGRDMNYGLYYACFVSDCYHPPIVSSMNTQSIKKKSNNFSISIRQSVKQPSIM